MFFKSDKPEAIQAVEQFFKDKSALHTAADRFAAAFDATAVVTHGINSVDYAGFVFNNPSEVNTCVWTKPLADRHKTSNLRVKPTKKEFRQEWEEASEKRNKLWDECFPNGPRISKDPIYEALGTDWGNVAFAGFGFFLHNGFVYVTTGLSDLDAQEILGSEYTQAVSDYKNQGDIK